MEFNLKTWNGLEAFLSNRRQFISCGDSKIETKIVKNLVPQSSIVGSLLFLIFVNGPVYFAGDRHLFCSDSNIRVPFETLNEELSWISDWCLANELYLNVEKIKFMLFHELIDQENIPLKLPSLQMNGNIVEIENSLKFLGVILDELLTWKNYIQLTEKKVSKNVGALYKTSK